MQAAPAGIEVWESADVVASASASVTWYHRNEYSVVPLTLKHQGLESLAHLVRDPLLQRTFGGRMTGPGFISEGSNMLKLVKPARDFSLSIATHTAQTRDADEWQQQLAPAPDTVIPVCRTIAWWNAFWNRSWIFVEGDKAESGIPNSKHPLRLGVDSTGASRFGGTLTRAVAEARVLGAKEIAKLAAARPQTTAPWGDISLTNGFTVAAWIKPAPRRTGAHLRQNHRGRQRRVSVGHASGPFAAVDCWLGRNGGARLPEARRVAACRRHGQCNDRVRQLLPEWPAAQSGRREHQQRQRGAFPRHPGLRVAALDDGVRRARELSDQVQRLDLHGGSRSSPAARTTTPTGAGGAIASGGRTRGCPISR